MGIFYTFRKGTKVKVNNGEREYVLEFATKHMARSFIEELHATQYDLAVNGMDKLKRRKSIICSPPDKTVTMNFHLERKKEREPIVALLPSEEDTKNFHEELSKAIFGESHESDDEP